MNELKGNSAGEKPCEEVILPVYILAVEVS
jgi:hypothetical protein